MSFKAIVYFQVCNVKAALFKKEHFDGKKKNEERITKSKTANDTMNG